MSEANGEYPPVSGSAPAISDDDILSLWRTVRPSVKQDEAMTYESGPYFVTCPTAELRHLVELAIGYAQNAALTGAESVPSNGVVGAAP